MTDLNSPAIVKARAMGAIHAFNDTAFGLVDEMNESNIEASLSAIATLLEGLGDKLQDIQKGVSGQRYE